MSHRSVLNGIGKASGAAVHQQLTDLSVKRNILAQHPDPGATGFSPLCVDFLVFGNKFLKSVTYQWVRSSIWASTGKNIPAVA